VTGQRVVVAAAVVRDGRLLLAQRSYPPHLAGCWELPGGKVEPGEGELDALRRECREELLVEVTVGARVGPEVTTADGTAVVRAYLATIDATDTPVAVDHQALMWAGPGELDDLPVLDADRPILAELEALLRRADPTAPG
jgi:8-oxo-dGTP diphosphatase